MTHYVCPKCGGASDVPKVCDTEGCSGKGNQLKECHCSDSQHQEVKQDANGAV